jgi:ribonuclease HI
MAKENLRVFNLKKEFSRRKMEDAKRKGPMWEARRRNRERQRLKHEAEKRRISRRKHRHARRYRGLQQTRKAIARLRGKKAVSGQELDKRLLMFAKEELDSTPTMRRKRLYTPKAMCEVVGIDIPASALHELKEIRLRLQGEDRVILYSDGSLKEAASSNVSMAFGVVYQAGNDEFPIVTAGRVGGYGSSTKAELVGLLASILASPRRTETTIYIDNAAVVGQFRMMVKERMDCTERQRLRSPSIGWWAAVHRAFVEQGEMITVKWVKGHAVCKGNIAADKVANSGHIKDMWKLKDREHSDLICHARFQNMTAEDDLRRILKRQSAVRNNANWTQQNRTMSNIKDWKEVDWKPTLNIVHNGNTPRSLFTSKVDCSLRAHRIKKLHGMLPTLTYMKTWKPHLYVTDICRACELEREDTQHLWECRFFVDEQKKGWEQAVNNVNVDGERAWRKEWKQWYLACKDARERGEPPPKLVEPKFTKIKVDIIWNFLTAKVDGLVQLFEDICDEDTVPLEDTGVRDWSIKDLYHGLTPKSWVAEWKTMFMTSTTTAKYMVGRFVKAIEEFGRNELWNKRCKFTVDWEKENGITSADKKAKAGSGGRKSFSSHPPRGPENSESADQRILQSYLREVDLNVMERLDSCKFLMTVDTG